MILNPSEPGNGAYKPYVENEGIIHDSDDPKVLLQSLLQFKKRQLSRCKTWAIEQTNPRKYKHDPRHFNKLFFRFV